MNYCLLLFVIFDETVVRNAILFPDLLIMFGSFICRIWNEMSSKQSKAATAADKNGNHRFVLDMFDSFVASKQNNIY